MYNYHFKSSSLTWILTFGQIYFVFLNKICVVTLLTFTLCTQFWLHLSSPTVKINSTQYTEVLPMFKAIGLPSFHSDANVIASSSFKKLNLAMTSNLQIVQCLCIKLIITFESMNNTCYKLFQIVKFVMFSMEVIIAFQRLKMVF
jgi:hypothetical protein